MVLLLRRWREVHYLLLDEIDLASNKIMCFNRFLKVQVSMLRKINKFVKPANGFNVVATANTKGQGSDDGKFIGTNVLNEAFLERFPITFEQNIQLLRLKKKSWSILLLSLMVKKTIL